MLRFVSPISELALVFWATDFARRNPCVEVVGLDLAVLPAQGSIAAERDVRRPGYPAKWPTDGPTAGPFDLIFGRQILLNLHEPAAALRQAWENLRPGESSNSTSRGIR